MTKTEYVTQLRSQRDMLKSYIVVKLGADNDYHAIADAAMDIREIDAQLKALGVEFVLPYSSNMSNDVPLSVLTTGCWSKS